VEPLVATLIGFLLWKEQVSFFKVIGILLILVSVLLLSLGKRDSKECSE
jgi:drug/metabolite transporter (DMT)-like permease